MKNDVQELSFPSSAETYNGNYDTLSATWSMTLQTNDRIHLKADGTSGHVFYCNSYYNCVFNGKYIHLEIIISFYYLSYNQNCRKKIVEYKREVFQKEVVKNQAFCRLWQTEIRIFSWVIKSMVLNLVFDIIIEITFNSQEYN